MLSGEYESVALSFIWVDRAGRIRREITQASIDAKRESIARLGLIHPLVVTREGKLVSGETRLEALRSLGWDRVPIQWSDTLDERELLSIELEENIKRTDLTWQDQCDALLKFHNLHREMDESWTQAKTADAIGLSQPSVAQQLGVAQELSRGNARVVAAPKMSTAVGIVKRQKERAISDAMNEIAEVSGPEGVPSSPILNSNFLEWIETYDGPSFNLLHCDFPYGIGADKFNQGAASSFGGYEDSPETYWALVEALISNRERLLGSSAHIIFWFSMRYYTETLAALREHFWVDPYPLIWHKSDNKGTLPDPERGPRRVYEVAFLCSLGDRKIIQSVSNLFSAPTVRDGQHMSEKSEEMLRYFMRMLVDDSTRMLDPTCGSGSALRAAASLGASVLGLELNPEFAENARRAWERRRA